MKWVRLKKKATIDSIIEFEDFFDVKLPEDFKAIVLQYNGGRPEKKILNIDNKSLVFYSLLSINKSDIYNVYKIYSWVQDKIDKKLVPIAEDPFGNYYCYDKSDNMTIKLWKHENESLIKICNSFAELTNLLTK